MAPEAPKTQLSETAREVAPHLQAAYVRLREYIRELDTTLVKLANKIANPNATDTQADRIDFEIQLAQKQSELLTTPEISDRDKTIRRNYLKGLRASVLATPPSTESDVETA